MVVKRRVWYWVVTVAAAAFMLLSAIPDLLQIPDAVSLFARLGYPRHLLPFLGTAKTLGALTILAPGAPRSLKEWAFAGLVFDLIGALYSHLSVGDPPSVWGPAVVGLVLVGSAYTAFRQLDRNRGPV
jgi:hypothetical protein